MQSLQKLSKYAKVIRIVSTIMLCFFFITLSISLILALFPLSSSSHFIIIISLLLTLLSVTGLVLEITLFIFSILLTVESGSTQDETIKLKVRLLSILGFVTLGIGLLNIIFKFISTVETILSIIVLIAQIVLLIVIIVKAKKIIIEINNTPTMNNFDQNYQDLNNNFDQNNNGISGTF